ncbi:MAG TPA: hypothetical protein VJ892_01145 [Candidatus Absconditabacterales bacterium]|nr:hypothetical protein [Candidatus Absconditabacterales bacterium]
MLKRLTYSLKQTWNSFLINIPIILGILILISILQVYFPLENILSFGNKIFSIFLADLLAGLFSGNPINSYILAGEIGFSIETIFLISVFLVSWITVGLVQIPAESYFFGIRYSIIRNILSFLFAILGGFLIMLLYNNVHFL